jgi:hypothetical protein
MKMAGWMRSVQAIMPERGKYVNEAGGRPAAATFYVKKLSKK